ncbi:PQQ-binding-like beta-propeller repeat protein [Actinomadura sp. WMMA1423]|uniref:outer membrane protein assembly factor BamB family protein n=1 Tax=Actinomadura sp. WMMA1423 TaxID=2591108 RepID=UPI001147791D|nr:PQQ-binding-like beta-propeller repeat protein [Actinomadura sp. WMMA1423]
MRAKHAGGAALALLLLASVAASSPPGPPRRTDRPDSVYGAGWSTAHADAGNTDYSPVAGARNLTSAWQRSFSGSIYLGATNDASGRVYVTTNGTGCHLHALDIATGKTVWCSGEVDRQAVSSSALIDKDGHLYLADGEAMRSFDAAGKVRWKTPIVGTPLSAQFTPAGNLLFITHIGRIYVLDRDTGEPVLPPVELIPGATPGTDDPRACMRGTEECPASNTPAVDLATGRVFFTFWDKGAPAADIRAMQLTEGDSPSIRPLWRNESLPGGSATSPDLSADGSRLYVGDNEGGIHALDAATGETIWSHDTGYAAGGSSSLSPSGLIMPAGGGDGGLMAIRDIGDRAERVWTKESLVNRGIPVQAAGGVAYAAVSATLGNDLVVVDTATGAELDRERLPGATLFSVGTTVAPDGTVLVPTITGELFAFRPG